MSHYAEMPLYRCEKCDGAFVADRSCPQGGYCFGKTPYAPPITSTAADALLRTPAEPATEESAAQWHSVSSPPLEKP